MIKVEIRYMHNGVEKVDAFKFMQMDAEELDGNYDEDSFAESIVENWYEDLDVDIFETVQAAKKACSIISVKLIESTARAFAIYDANCDYHCDNGIALAQVVKEGSQEWIYESYYIHSRLHRLDGPAIVVRDRRTKQINDDRCEWYVDGMKCLNPNEPIRIYADEVEKYRMRTIDK